MKKPHFDQSLEHKLRALLILSEDQLEIRRLYLEQLGMTDSTSYMKTIKALNIIREIKEEIGYKVPEGPTLKQTEIAFKE